MESDNSPPSTSLKKCCDCNCICSKMKTSLSATSNRSVRRKYVEEKEFSIPGFIIPQTARVEIENECMALREMVNSQQQTLQDLISELEEERNASSSAANEAMSMILRLQRDKAEIQMELRQFKRFTEEKMAHDQEETLVLEDLLYKGEEAIQSLTCEVQAYKHWMMSHGFAEAGSDGDWGMSQNNNMIESLEGQSECPPLQIYPPLKCNSDGSWAYPNGDDKTPDIEKYAFVETPRPCDQLKDLDYRINQLEKSPSSIQPDGEFSGSKNVLEKVIVGQSPRAQRHLRKFSADPINSPLATPRLGSSFKKTEFSHVEEDSNFRNVDNESEVGDDLSDRIYTVDYVHQVASINGLMTSKASGGIDGDEYVETPRESLNNSIVKDLEIQKLHARLHALEADRESMKQAIVSIGTGTAQVVLLKEIAQNLCKDMALPRSMPLRKQSVVGSFSFMSIFKWVLHMLFWWRTACRCRYMFGLSANNAGLLVLLDRSPRVGQ